MLTHSERKKCLALRMWETNRFSERLGSIQTKMVLGFWDIDLCWWEMVTVLCVTVDAVKRRVPCVSFSIPRRDVEAPALYDLYVPENNPCDRRECV